MAGATLAPAAPGATVLEASATHPLENLGLDTQSTQGPDLLAALGQMPGAAQAVQEREAMAGQALANQQQQYVQPQPAQQQQYAPAQTTPAQPQPGQIAQFNQQLEQGHTGPGQAPVQQPGQQVAETEAAPSYATQDDYDFLVGLVQDQAEAMGAMQNPSALAAGAPPDPFAAPQAQPQTQPQTFPTQPQIAPIATPQLAPAEISEAEFEKIKDDRQAMAAFLAKREQATAANVTQQLASTILPHVQGYITKQAENDRAVNTFMAANLDLAEHPEALDLAVREAKQLMPYAKPERIMYYAGRKLRGAMATNQNIESNVHDLRSNTRGRRGPVINNPAELRRGPGNVPQTNPFEDLKNNMIALRKQDGGILQQLQIG